MFLTLAIHVSHTLFMSQFEKFEIVKFMVKYHG